MSIILALIVFTIIVVIHELGHFMAARKCGILVEEFSVGMGPRIFSFKPGETMYSLKLFPIGGSCRMLGEDEENADPRSFNAKPVSSRILVVTAGVIMNLILALIIAFLISLNTMYYVPAVRAFTEGSPAQAAGLQVGDKILYANGEKIKIYNDFAFVMMDADGSSISLVIDRNGSQINYEVTPILAKDGYKVGFFPAIKAGPFYAKTELDENNNVIVIDEVPGVTRADIGESLVTGFHDMVFSVKSTYVGLVRMVTEKFDPGKVAGPVGIVTMIGEQYEESIKVSSTAAFWSVMRFVYLLSANLAVVNLLPLPALDGGRLIFLIVEAVRRKPVDQNKEGMIHFAGFVLLMVFAVFIAYNDIAKLLIPKQ